MTSVYSQRKMIQIVFFEKLNFHYQNMKLTIEKDTMKFVDTKIIGLCLK